MRSTSPILLLLSIASTSLSAQVDQSTTLTIGDPAPPLRIREWPKGDPFQHFEKGRVYVLEFWATWCAPCRAAIPHLSALAGKYKDKVTIIGVDLLGQEIVPLKKVKAFVDSMGDRMNYHVAAEDSNFMRTGWMDATGASGIPHTYVVDGEGRLGIRIN